MKIYGWLKNDGGAASLLSSFDVARAEYDSNIPGVMFTTRPNEQFNVLLRVEDEDAAKEIVQKCMGEGVSSLNLTKETKEHPLWYVERPFMEDEEEQLEDGEKAKKKSGRKRRIVIGLLVAAILIGAFFAPVWKVQIKGDETPYKLYVIVDNSPQVTERNAKGETFYINPGPKVIGWSLLPHDAEPLTGDHSLDIWQSYDGTKMTLNPMWRPYWDEIDLELSEVLLGCVPNAILSDSSVAQKFIVSETLYRDGKPVQTNRNSLIGYSGNFVVKGKPSCLISCDNESIYIYDGITVQITTTWLKKRYSLLTILCNDSQLEAERVNKISLIGAGA